MQTKCTISLTAHKILKLLTIATYNRLFGLSKSGSLYRGDPCSVYYLQMAFIFLHCSERRLNNYNHQKQRQCNIKNQTLQHSLASLAIRTHTHTHRLKLPAKL